MVLIALLSADELLMLLLLHWFLIAVFCKNEISGNSCRAATVRAACWAFETAHVIFMNSLTYIFNLKSLNSLESCLFSVNGFARLYENVTKISEDGLCC